MIANPHCRSGARGIAFGRNGARGRASRRSATAATLIVAALVLTACGSSRPSVDDIKAQIAKAGGDKVTDAQAECLAKTYYDSDLSDAAVKLLVNAKDVTSVKRADLSKKDQAASDKLYTPLKACLQGK